MRSYQGARIHPNHGVRRSRSSPAPHALPGWLRFAADDETVQTIHRGSNLKPVVAAASPALPARFAPYAIAVAAVATAAVLTAGIENRFGSTYLFFYPALVLSAALGGLGPGLLATVAAAGVVLLWILPARGVGPGIPVDQAARTALFVGMGSIVSLGFELYRRAIHRAARLEKENALRSSDQHLRTVLDAAQDGFWMLDGEGRIVDANPAACAMTGYDRGELLGRSVAEIAAGEVPAAERIRQVQERGSDRFDSWLRRKDGSLARVSVSMSQTGLAGGLMVCFFRDVTRKREMEEDLRRARRTLLVITRCDEAILRATKEGELFAEVCRVIVETGGYRMCWVGVPENDARRTIRPVAHAGHEDGYLATVDAVWADEPRGRGPTGVAVREGRIVVGPDFASDPTLAPWKAEALRRGYGSATAVPIAHGGEKVGVLVMYSADVTAFSEEELRLLGQLADDLAFGVHALRERAARARADASREAALLALSAEQDRFRALIERSSDLTLIVDGEGIITFSSPASLEVLGIEPLQGIGKAVMEFIHPEDRARAVEVIDALRRDPATTRRMDLRVRRADGTFALVEAQGRSLVDVPGVRGIVVNGRDITERNRLRDQLQQVQKLDSIGRLAGGVAHDFNNLLTVMLSCGEDLRQAVAEGTPPAQETIEDLVGAGERAREITRQLLAFARRQPIAPVCLDLNGAIRDGARLLRRAIGEEVEMVEDLQPEAWRIRFDPGLLGQVLMNLALNARDAMPGGGRLVLSTRNVTLAPGAPPPLPEIPPGDHVRLGVKDSGTGMSPETMEHLFEPFFTTKPSGAGTGLGLPTVYGIVKQGGGWIGVQSTPGEGTAFGIWFPRDAGA
jgi:PAS domain S-box-containing protein